MEGTAIITSLLLVLIENQYLKGYICGLSKKPTLVGRKLVSEAHNINISTSKSICALGKHMAKESSSRKHLI